MIVYILFLHFLFRADPVIDFSLCSRILQNLVPSAPIAIFNTKNCETLTQRQLIWFV